MEICLDEFSQSPYEAIKHKYKHIKTIGHGSFGTVIIAKCLKTDKEVAVKIINKASVSKSINFKNEVDVLKGLRHSNIVKFYDFIDTVSYFFIVMEYINGITLQKYIDNLRDDEENDGDSMINLKEHRN